MDKLEQRVAETIRKYDMLKEGDRVIVALSGGADSVCLFSVLLQLRGKLGIELRAVHVHHGLRGVEADRDAEFAEALCERYAVPCHIIRADVRRAAAERGVSEEEAGRLLRYEALEREALLWEAEDGTPSLGLEWESVPKGSAQSGQEPGSTAASVRIAVAHHSGDQAETILHNLFRGSGLLGLRGIPYVRGRIIRPLLDVNRKEILAWLEARNLPFVQDSTNALADYTRNRIRIGILPAIESQVNANAAGNILRTGRLAGMADAYLTEQGRRWIEQYVKPESCPSGEIAFFLPAASFETQPEILRFYIVMELLTRLSGSAKDLGFVHAEQIISLLDRPVGRQTDLPYGLRARRDYEGIFVERPGSGGRTVEISLPTVETQRFPYKKGVHFPKNMYTKWFDCDRIKGMPMVRTRQPGDYITLADGNTKALRRFMIDEKIPKAMRDGVPLLADGSHVMWVIGYRISSYYKVGPETKEIFQARVMRPDPRTGETEDKNDGR